MRNRWFPARVADYVPFTQLKELKARDVAMERDFTFGVRVNLEEVEEEAEDLLTPKKRYVRPIEIDVLSVCPAMLMQPQLEPTLTCLPSLSAQSSFSTPLSRRQSTSRASASSRSRRRDRGTAQPVQLTS
jgi:hypothetical protein